MLRIWIFDLDLPAVGSTVAVSTRRLLCFRCSVQLIIQHKYTVQLGLSNVDPIPSLISKYRRPLPNSISKEFYRLPYLIQPLVHDKLYAPLSTHTSNATSLPAATDQIHSAGHELQFHSSNHHCTTYMSYILTSFIISYMITKQTHYFVHFSHNALFSHLTPSTFSK